MKHFGALNSDAAINTYQRQYDDMTRKYRIDPDRLPLLRRVRQWVTKWFRSIW